MTGHDKDRPKWVIPKFDRWQRETFEKMPRNTRNLLESPHSLYRSAVYSSHTNDNSASNQTWELLLVQLNDTGDRLSCYKRKINMSPGGSQEIRNTANFHCIVHYTQQQMVICNQYCDIEFKCSPRYDIFLLVVVDIKIQESRFNNKTLLHFYQITCQLIVMHQILLLSRTLFVPVQVYIHVGYILSVNDIR